MGFLEVGIPKQHRKAFVRAVAARARRNTRLTPTSVTADYKAMNALPTWLQVIAAQRAKKL